MINGTSQNHLKKQNKKINLCQKLSRDSKNKVIIEMFPNNSSMKIFSQASYK